MTAKNLLTRVPRHFVKTVTFDGGAGSGAVGTVAIATVSGRVMILRGSVYCTTLLAGASATIELGVAGNTAALIAQTTATDVDATEFWQDATPEVGVSPGIVDKNVSLDIILTVATADVDSGVLEFAFEWIPMSETGRLS